MTYGRVLCAAASLATLSLTAPGPVMAQIEEEPVPLVMMKPQGAGLGMSSLRKLYAAVVEMDEVLMPPEHAAMTRRPKFVTAEWIVYNYTASANLSSQLR